MIEIWDEIGCRNPNSCAVPPVVEIGIAESRGRVEGYKSEGLRVTKVYNFFLNPPKLEALCNRTLDTAHGPALPPAFSLPGSRHEAAELLLSHQKTGDFDADSGQV
ncbi:hypothetical protein ACLB2K_023138 [Fragaria x ananassa]